LYEEIILETSLRLRGVVTPAGSMAWTPLFGFILVG
jgi:hypothetical protein